MATPYSFLCSVLRYHFFFANLSQNKICTRCHSLGGCLCQLNRLHRHVANGKEKSRKLVLVDCNEHCFDSFVLCKTLRVHKCVLFSLARHGSVWLNGMDQESEVGKRKGDEFVHHLTQKETSI